MKVAVIPRLFFAVNSKGIQNLKKFYNPKYIAQEKLNYLKMLLGQL